MDAMTTHALAWATATQEAATHKRNRRAIREHFDGCERGRGDEEGWRERARCWQAYPDYGRDFPEKWCDPCLFAQAEKANGDA